MLNQFSRTQLLLGQDGMERLFRARVAVFGIGGVDTSILLNGIPGCERNLDLAQALRWAGFHVMTFHYSGSWGSDGDYSLTHDLEDADTVLDFILQNKAMGSIRNIFTRWATAWGGCVRTADRKTHGDPGRGPADALQHRPAAPNCAGGPGGVPDHL